MSSLDFLRSSVRALHQDLIGDVKELNDGQLHFRPLEKGNSIAFIFWHVVRTEDSVIQYLLQKKPPVWNAEGWDKKFGMDPRAQGTGMPAEQAASLRISDLKDFLKYADHVFRAVEAHLDVITEADLEKVQEFQFLGKRSGYEVYGGIVLRHGAEHVGEIRYIKGLQGLKGSPI